MIVQVGKKYKNNRGDVLVCVKVEKIDHTDFYIMEVVKKKWFKAGYTSNYPCSLYGMPLISCASYWYKKALTLIGEVSDDTR